MVNSFPNNRQKRDVRDIMAINGISGAISTESSSSSAISSNPANLTILIEGMVSIYQSLIEILQQSNMSWARVFLDSSPDNLKFLLKTPLNEHYIISR